MNNFIFLFLVLVAAAAAAAAADNPELVLPDPSQPSVEVEETSDDEKFEKKYVKYDKILSLINESIDNFDKFDFYSKVKNGPNYTWSQSDVFIFYVFQAQKISDMMFIVDYSWNKQFNSLNDNKEKDFLKKKITQLVDLRKKHANKFENLLEEKLKIIDINEQEKNRLLDKIKKWNKEQKLKDEPND